MKTKKIIGTLEVQNGQEFVLSGHDSNGKELFKSTSKMKIRTNKKSAFSVFKVK